MPKIERNAVCAAMMAPIATNGPYKPRPIGKSPRTMARIPMSAAYGTVVATWSCRGTRVASCVRMVVSAIGEKTFPKSDPPSTHPKQCLRMLTSPPPSCHARGPMSGKRMPMVPNELPVANEMRYDKIVVMAGSPHAGSPRPSGPGR